MMLAVDVTGSPFQNPTDPYDVNDNGYVDASDALEVIRALNIDGSGQLELAEGENDTVTTAQTSNTSYIDVNGDRILNSRDALNLIQELNGESEPGDVVEFRLEITDLAGSPISEVEVGDEFELRVFTRDTQDSADFFGVFAAYLDVEYNAALATITGELQFAGELVNGTSGDTLIDGLINEVGAIAGLSPTGQGELEVFSVRLQATGAGQLTVSTNAADEIPGHDVLVFGLNDAVDVNDILYGSTTLTITDAQQPEVDLAAFARALDAAGVELWSTKLNARARIADQLNLFEDGEAFLPFHETLAPSLEINDAAQAAGVTFVNTWIFPDESRSEGTLLTLQQISDRSGVPIPTGVGPSIAPIDDVIVLNGSPLHIPLDGYDPNGDPLTYTVTSGDATLVTTFVPQGNRSLRISVSDAVGSYGDMVFELFEGRAPRATDQIITLANDGFYDGITFHRVIDGFVIQGGDPTGTGSGGSDLGDFDDDFHADLQHNRGGILSMAKTADDTNDSQFFITETDTRFLDFQHTIFGQLIEGDRVRETISNQETGSGDRPVLTITMDNVEVFTDNENAVVMLTALQSSGTTEITVKATDIAGNSTIETFMVTVELDSVNGQPFLKDIPEQVFQPGEPVQFQLTAIDVEGDPVSFSASTNVSGASVDVDDQGLVTVTPPADFVGTLPVTVRAFPTNGVPSGSMDDQLVNIRIVADRPSNIDLLAVSDTGISDTDNITRLTELQFQIDGVEDGATVKILLDGETEVGEGVASGNSITITTANLSALGDDQHKVTAVQVVDGEQSLPSAPITIFLDQTAPAPILNDAPTETDAFLEYSYDPDHEEEGDSGFRYSLGTAPNGMLVDENTGEISWTPSIGQSGEQSYELIVTDSAGNSTSRTTVVNVAGDAAQFRLVVTNTSGEPISGIALGSDFLLQVFVSDLRGTPTGLSDAFLDIAFDGTLATVNGALDFGADFPDDNSGTVTTGLIDEVGGSTTASLGSGESLLVAIPMQATLAGTLTFSGNPADDASHEVLLFGETVALADDELSFADATISVLPVAQELTANPDTAEVDEDSGETTIDVLANDTLGPDGESIEIASVTVPDRNGTAVISTDGQSILFTPAADFFGEETFSYTIRDSQGATVDAVVTVTVNPINDPPLPNDDFFPEDFPEGDIRISELVEDSLETPIALPIITNDSNFPDSDTDGNEVFFITKLNTENTSGTVTINEGGFGGVFYTPAPDFFGVDTFTYTVTDLHDPALSGTATVTVTVPEVNDAPIATSDQFDVPLNTPLTIDPREITGNDSAGPDNESDQELTIVDVSGAENGTVVLNADGSVTYTPRDGFSGADTFTYRVSDDGTTRGTSDPLETTGTVTLNVGVGNAAPEAFDDVASVVGDSAATTLSLLDNDTTNDSGETLFIESISDVSDGGTVTIIDGGAAVSYQPAAGFFGTETFTYTVSDGDLTDTGVVTVTVTDPAIATDSEFSGFVFFDGDNNGEMDPGEQGISGITIRLEGTDVNGLSVSREQVTDADGQYRFLTLPQGKFSISQEQPSFLIDGIDTADEFASVSSNDTFDITVTDTVVTSDGNMFAERGLSPRFAMLEALASSQTDIGFLTAISNGESQWIRHTTGWEDYQSVKVTLSDDLSEVIISAIDKDSQEVEVTVPTSDRSKVQLLGRDGDTVLVRIAAAAVDFDLNVVTRSASGVASSDFVAAVDTVFADDAA